MYIHVYVWALLDSLVGEWQDYNYSYTYVPVHVHVCMYLTCLIGYSQDDSGTLHFARTCTCI